MRDTNVQDPWDRGNWMIFYQAETLNISLIDSVKSVIWRYNKAEDAERELEKSNILRPEAKMTIDRQEHRPDRPLDVLY